MGRNNRTPEPAAPAPEPVETVPTVGLEPVKGPFACEARLRIVEALARHCTSEGLQNSQRFIELSRQLEQFVLGIVIPEPKADQPESAVPPAQPDTSALFS
jgi:hypothetical protein